MLGDILLVILQVLFEDVSFLKASVKFDDNVFFSFPAFSFNLVHF